MCLRFADRPCFIAADPTIFSQKIKKTRQFSGPASVVPDFSLGIQNFCWIYSIWYVVKPFTDTFVFCQFKIATFSNVAFLFKKMWSPWSEKLVWSNKSSPDDLGYLMTTIHEKKSFFFGLISLLCCMMLLVLEERKLNAFITDYTNSHFIIYKNARYVPFFQCLR